MDFPLYLPDLCEGDSLSHLPACAFVLDAQLIWPAFRYLVSPHCQTLAAPLIQLAPNTPMVDPMTPMDPMVAPIVSMPMPVSVSVPAEALEPAPAPPRPPARSNKTREKDVGVWRRAQPVLDEEKRGNPANKKKTKTKKQRQRGRQRGREICCEEDACSTSSESITVAANALVGNTDYSDNNSNNDDNSTHAAVERSLVGLSTQESSSLSSATQTQTQTQTQKQTQTQTQTQRMATTSAEKKPLVLVEKRRGERAKDDGLVFRTIDPDTGDLLEIVYGFRNAHVIPDIIPSSKCASSFATTAEDISDVTDGD